MHDVNAFVYVCRAEPADALDSEKTREAAAPISIPAAGEQQRAEPGEPARTSGPALEEAIALATAIPAEMQPVPEDQQQNVIVPFAASNDAVAVTHQTEGSPEQPFAVVHSTAVTETVDTVAVVADDDGIAVLQSAAVAESVQTSAVAADGKEFVAVQTSAAVSTAAVTTVNAAGKTVTVAARSELAEAAVVIATEEGTSVTESSTAGTAMTYSADEGSAAALQGAMQSAVQAVDSEENSGHAAESSAMLSKPTLEPEATVASSSKSTEGTNADDTFVLAADEVPSCDSVDNSQMPSAQDPTLESMHASLRRARNSPGT